MGETSKTYSIAELTERGGVSRRTVRYYVTRGLLPAPTGTGRGKHYTQEHLDTLIRIRTWQEAGVPLAEIQERLQALPQGEPAPGTREVPDPLASPGPASSPAPRMDQVDRVPWIRVSLEPGIELHFASDRGLSDLTIARIAQRVRDMLPRTADASHTARDKGENHE